MSGEQTEIGWAVLELMGHRKLAGFVTEDQGLIRIDVYDRDPAPPGPESTSAATPVTPIATQWYGRAAIYCISATTMENCVGLTQRYRPAPIGRYELPAADDEIEDAELAAQPDDEGDWG